MQILQRMGGVVSRIEVFLYPGRIREMRYDSTCQPI